MGLSNALSQQEGLTSEANNMNQFIAEQNNSAMADYHSRISGMKTGDTHENEFQLSKIGAYGIDGANKISEYHKAVKEGKIVKGIGGSKVFQGLNKLSKGDTSDFTSQGGTLIKPDDPSLKGVNTAQDSLGDATSEEMGGKLLIENEGSVGKQLGKGQDFVENNYEKPTTSKILGVSGKGESFIEQATREGTGEILRTPAMTGATNVEKALSGVEGSIEGGSNMVKTFAKAGGGLSKAVGGLAKASGGLMSVAMLGDDIYNQVTNKEFFTGDNAGEKIGNFANEVGSVMDIAGAGTGDPFLVMAGVGVGAVGSVISEVGSLFANKKKETEAEKSFKPVAVQEVASQNIVGSGRVAESSSSTLKQQSY